MLHVEEEQPSIYSSWYLDTWYYGHWTTLQILSGLVKQEENRSRTQHRVRASHRSRNGRYLNGILIDAVTFFTFWLRWRSAVMPSIQLSIKHTEAAASRTESSREDESASVNPACDSKTWSQMTQIYLLKSWTADQISVRNDFKSCKSWKWTPPNSTRREFKWLPG